MREPQHAIVEQQRVVDHVRRKNRLSPEWREAAPQEFAKYSTKKQGLSLSPMHGLARPDPCFESKPQHGAGRHRRSPVLRTFTFAQEDFSVLQDIS
jgi:hypothetical protein